MNLDTLLRYHNPWWAGREDPVTAPDRKLITRGAFEPLERSLDEPGVELITGIRRVGKSVLLHELVNSLLGAGINPRQILMFQFEETTRPVPVEDVIERYFDVVLEGTPDLVSGKVYLFLDEIQFQPDWQAHIKRYYDLFPGHVKVVVSGSHSRMIKQKAGESLAGRVGEHQVDVLTFSEFLRFFTEETAPRVDLDTLVDEPEARARLFKSLQFHSATETASLAARYDHYIRTGQFPEVATAEMDKAYEYVNQRVIERVLRLDLPQAFEEEIGKPRALHELYGVLAEESGAELVLQNVAREIGVDRRTLQKYLRILREGYLVRLVSNYQPSTRKTFRLDHKCYVGASSIFAAHQRYDPLVFDDPLVTGFMVECAVLDQLSTLFGSDVSFWREQKKEVDFLVRVGSRRTLLPIEVKSGRRIRGKDLLSMRACMRRFRLDLGLVISRERFNAHPVDEGMILELPAWTLG